MQNNGDRKDISRRREVTCNGGSVVVEPEFCKELGKKSSEHRMNTGVQSFFEMHRSVVFFTHF